MSDLYNKIEQLCQELDINITEMCRQAEVSRGNLTDLKNGRQTGLSAKNMDRIAAYLGVPVGFLLGRSPFEGWELINQNRAGFLHYVDIPKNVQYALWGINPVDPNQTPLKNFINFIDSAVIRAEPTSEGDWAVEVKDTFKTQKNATTNTGRGLVSDADIKFALFGNAEIDDEVLDEVKRFAKFAIEQKEQRKQSD